MFFGTKGRTGRRITGAMLALCLSFTAEFEVLAADIPEKRHEIDATCYDIDAQPLEFAWEQIGILSAVAVSTQDWYGKALPDTDTELDVYADGTDVIIGKLYPNTVVDVEEKSEEWSRVASGQVRGVVRTENLLFGSAAVARASITCAMGIQEAKTVEQLKEQERIENIRLLATIIYCEAGNQPYDGKVAVGSVVMNRIASRRFPDTVESVLYQRGQFTPVKTGKFERVLAAGRVPLVCYQAAEDAFNGAKPVGNAMFFNTKGGELKLGDHYFH